MGSALSNLGVGIAGLVGAFDPNAPGQLKIEDLIKQYTGQVGNIYASQNQYLPLYGNLYNQLEQGQVGSQAGSFAGIYPQLRAGYQGAYPEYGGLIQGAGNLYSQTQSDLALGTELDPRDARRIQQNYMAASPMHGGGGGYDQAGAAISQYLAGNQLRQQRIGNYLGAQGGYAQLLPGAPGLQAPNVGAQGASQWSSGMYGNPYNPEIFNANAFNINSQWAYQKFMSQLRQASANQTGQGAGGIFDAAIGGGFGGMGGMMGGGGYGGGFGSQSPGSGIGGTFAY